MKSYRLGGWRIWLVLVVFFVAWRPASWAVATGDGPRVRSLLEGKLAAAEAANATGVPDSKGLDARRLLFMDESLPDPYRGVPSMFLDADGKPLMLEAMALENAPVKDFLMRRLNEEGINVIIDPHIHCRVSMRLKNVELWSAVERLLGACNLSWQVNGNILEIKRMASISESQDKQVLIIRPCYLRYLKATEVRDFILGETKIRHTDLESRPGKNQSTEENSDSGTSENGLLSKGTKYDEPTVVADVSTNCIIIKDVPENVRRIIKLIRAMDHPRPQLKIQAWIVETSKSVAREVGVRWSGYLKIGDTNIFSASRDLKDGAASEFTYPAQGIERGILSPLDPRYQVDPETGQASYDHEVVSSPYTGRLYSLGVAASGSAGAIVADIQALESTGDMRVLSRPELVLQDNSEATITQGQDIYHSYLTDYYQGTTQINAKLEVTVRPHIAPDGSIIIDIWLKDRWPNEALSTDRNIVVNEKGIQTRLIVKSGQTVVLGGIKHSRSEDDKDGVPVLKDLPVFGSLFRHSSKSDKLDELLLIMHPVILPLAE